MNNHIKSMLKTLSLGLIVSLALLSCKEEASIQNYFVTHQDKPEFLTLDLSPNMINISDVNLNEEQKEVYKSFKKVNILAYKVRGKRKNIY